MTNRLSPLTAEEILELVAVARGDRPAEVWVKDGTNLNLYTGELERVHIAIKGKRIAYVGPTEPKYDHNTHVIEASDYTLVPGYIEPHAHPFQLYNPISLADYVLTKGTTTYIADNMFFFNMLSMDEWRNFMEECGEHPVKILWWSRLDSQSDRSDLVERYKGDRIAENLLHPMVIQAGELTQWAPLFFRDRTLAEKIALAKSARKRIEGHAPGASHGTLTALAAAGITADHEAISGEEVYNRLKLGYYVPLRHSSIRPDLTNLLTAIKDLRLGWERLMLTTDGSTPSFIENGFTDVLISLALEAGVDPSVAYRMATLNVATYYGIDDQIGGIAPGRLADILFLESLENPTPIQVIVDGKLIIPKQDELNKDKEDFQSRVNISWESYGLEYKDQTSWKIKPEQLYIPWEDGKPFPVIHLINDVITVQDDQIFPVKNGELYVEDEEILYIALVDQKGKWITRGLLRGFAKNLDGLASTFTMSMDYLVIGRDATSMAVALEHVRAHSGIALVENQKVSEHLSLPVGGGMSLLEMGSLITETNRIKDFLEIRGYKNNDPFYCLLFLSSPHLPKLRLTEKGIISVKDQRIILPSQTL